MLDCSLRRGRLALTFTMAIACDTAPPPARAPVPVVALPSATMAPPVERGPLVLQRAPTPAPWLEPVSEPLPLWDTGSTSANGVTHMVDPVLRETQLVLAEPNAIVIRTAVGQLIRTRDGYLAMLDREPRIVAVTATGKLVLDARPTQIVRELGPGRVTASTRAPWSPRVLDASGKRIVADDRGTLVVSDDEGATFVPVRGLPKTAPARAWIRSDGVGLVELAGTGADRFHLFDAARGARKVTRPLRDPGRIGGLIHANAVVSHPDEIDRIDVLASDGRTWNVGPPPAALASAGYVSFHPLFLSAPTSTSARPFAGDLLATIPAPSPPPGARTGSSARAMARSEGYGLIGLLNASAGAISDPPPPCRGLLCIAENRPPGLRDVGSRLDARFFDDGLCAGAPDATCDDKPFVRPPTVGFFRGADAMLALQRAPADCIPERLFSARGLVVLECKRGRHVADATLRFVAETGRARPDDDLAERHMAEDGTLLLVARREGRPTAAQLRRPVSPGTAGAWRDLRMADAPAQTVEVVVLGGGGALLVESNATGDRLTLIVDGLEGRAVVARDVPVSRQVMRVFVEDDQVIVVPLDTDTPKALVVQRDGTLAPPRQAADASSP